MCIMILNKFPLIVILVILPFVSSFRVYDILVSVLMFQPARR
jgi:hypothetical protein